MSGTWSRKRRNVPASSVPAPISRVPMAPRPPDPLPSPMELQQLLLSRSTEKMFEEAEQSGVLSLAGRKFKEFPTMLAEKYDISDLVAADLSSNRMVDLPASICALRSLESLKVRQNVLRRVPSNIVQLDALTFLDLSNNQLVQLPLTMFELPLEILLLTGNRLTGIPREIRQLSSTLTELDLSYNMLTSIPADIALLKMLRVLVLKKNCLDQFPSELCRLSLHSLDLSFNKYSQLPLHIRKMKTLVDLRINDNPLVSPPASVVSKGREHIFKWMDMTSGGGHLASGSKNSHSASTITALNIGRSSASFHCADTSRKSSAPPPMERRARSSRFQTITGSDSGYGSTADEHRLSHELVPSALDDINEYSVCSLSPDEGIQDPDNEMSSESTSLKSIASNDGITSQESVVVITECELTKKITQVKLEDTKKITQNNTQKISRVVDEKDVKNNNSPRPATNTSKSTVPGVPPASHNKPISKVAPLMTSARSSNNTNNSNLNKPSSVNRSTASNTKLQTTTTTTSSTNRSMMSSRSSSASTVVANNRSRPVRETTNLVRPTVAPTSRKVSRVTDNKTITAPSTKADANGNVNSRKNSITPPTTTTTNSTTSGLDAFRKVFEERLGVSLSAKREGISAELSDGVHLCNLVNALKPKSVLTVFPHNEKEIISPLKAKRNVDGFVTACKRMGISENLVCTSSDVLAKRNLPSIVKTVVQLNRLAAKPTDNRIISHV